MLEWGEDPSAALGYVVQDLSGDGVPELVIGFLPDHSILQYAVYTLADGSPKPVSYTHLDVYKRQRLKSGLKKVKKQSE